MTLRECADSFITHVSNKLFTNCEKTYFGGEKTYFGGDVWNVLSSEKARNYIISELSNKFKSYDIECYLSEKMNDEGYWMESYWCMVICSKTIIKKPISSLELDDPFTWDEIELC